MGWSEAIWEKHWRWIFRKTSTLKSDLHQKRSLRTAIIETFFSVSQPRIVSWIQLRNCSAWMHDGLCCWSEHKKHKQSGVAANVNTENRRKPEKIVFEIAGNVVCVLRLASPGVDGRQRLMPCWLPFLMSVDLVTDYVKVNATLETNSLKMKQLRLRAASDDFARSSPLSDSGAHTFHIRWR